MSRLALESVLRILLAHASWRETCEATKRAIERTEEALRSLS